MTHNKRKTFGMSKNPNLRRLVNEWRACSFLASAYDDIISFDAIAQRIRVSPSLLSRLLSGDRIIGMATAAALAELTGQTVDGIFAAAAQSRHEQQART